MPIDLSKIRAIDVHVHLEHMGKATAADDQAKKYFGAGAERDWNALADYYRSRKMACVVFTVHEATSWSLQASSPDQTRTTLSRCDE